MLGCVYFRYETHSLKVCKEIYIDDQDEINRRLKVSVTDHRVEVEAPSNNSFTRTKREQSQSKMKKSTAPDPEDLHNHIMDWDSARIVCTESVWVMGGIRGAITSWQTHGNMN